MDVTVADTNFKQEVLESEIPVLIDFWAEWCMPCRMMSPIIEDIAKEYHGKLKVGKLNVDESPQIASTYGIMSIPTLVIFKKGEAVETMVGAIPKADIVSKIEIYI